MDRLWRCHTEPKKLVTGHMLYEVPRAIRQERHGVGRGCQGLDQEEEELVYNGHRVLVEKTKEPWRW